MALFSWPTKSELEVESVAPPKRIISQMNTDVAQLNSLIHDFKMPVKIVRVWIYNADREFSQVLFSVSDDHGNFLGVDGGYTAPPNQLWLWTGTIEGSEFKFECRSIIDDDVLVGVWYF